MCMCVCREVKENIIHIYIVNRIHAVTKTCGLVKPVFLSIYIIRIWLLLQGIIISLTFDTIFYLHVHNI